MAETADGEVIVNAIETRGRGPGRFYFSFAFALCLCAQGAFSDARKADLRSVVEDVYRRYAWVVVFSGRPADSKVVPIAREPLATLQEMFVDDLANAIFDDAACVKSTKEICALDFDILFASQDPQAIDLEIHQEQSGHVKVCFKGLQNHLSCISYVGQIDQGAVKIFDVVYSEGPSLRQLLGTRE